jgi:hypothetical protein
MIGFPFSLHGKDKEYDPTTLVFPPFKHTLGFHKAKEIHLKIFLGHERSFDRPTGIAAVKLKSRDDPNKKSDDDELTIYGLNSGKGEIIYNTSMYSAAVYGKKGSGKGEFLAPRDIAADTEGNVFVADTGNDRIVHLIHDTKKNALEEVAVLPTIFEDIPLHDPSGVTLDCTGTLYIADRRNDRIVCTDYGGKLKQVLGKIQPEHSLRSPVAIAVTDERERWSFYKKDYLFVIDSDGQRLLKLSHMGRLIAARWAKDLPCKKAKFVDVALDFYSNVYVTDSDNCCIYKFDRNLDFVTTFGRCGTKDKEFVKPWGITIWKRFGQLFVTEEKGAQYYWIGVDFKEVSVFESRYPDGTTYTKINVHLTEPAFLTVRIENEKKEIVWDEFKDEKCNRFQNIIPWKRTDGTGKAVPPGTYTIIVEARATYSSKKYFSIQTTRTVTIG